MHGKWIPDTRALGSASGYKDSFLEQSEGFSKGKTHKYAGAGGSCQVSIGTFQLPQSHLFTLSVVFVKSHTCHAHLGLVPSPGLQDTVLTWFISGLFDLRCCVFPHLFLSSAGLCPQPTSLLGGP